MTLKQCQHTIAFIALSVFKSVTFKVYDIAEPRARMPIDNHGQARPVDTHIILFSFLVLFPMIDALRILHTCRVRRYASARVARTMRSEINSNCVSPSPPYSLSASVSRRVELSMGRLRQDDGRDARARARARRARAHLKKIND